MRYERAMRYIVSYDIRESDRSDYDAIEKELRKLKGVRVLV